MDLLISVYIKILVVIFVYSSIWFILSIIFKRNDIADIAWGLGFILINSCLMYYGYNHTEALIIYSLVSVWGLRLAIYIFQRLLNKGEDFRYKNWREEWGRRFYIRTYLQVFLLQGFIMSVIALPIIAIAIAEPSKSLFLIIPGVLLWLIGFYWQVVADNQLNSFKKTNRSKGSFIQTGLWAKSRHPNYWGEVLMWWGVFLAVLPFTEHFYIIISPILITYLLRYVSGVPMLENKYKENKEYQSYKKETPVLMPFLFSKKR
jgi:steroid 5-alpha reductase family enzyme